MRKTFLLVCFIASLACLGGVARHVPGEYPTIQGALDACVAGDSVLVAPGVYHENLVWPQIDGIGLIGDDRDGCIVDGSGTARVLGFVGDWQNPVITQATRVKNLTLRNGFTSANGVGVLCNYASPTITNCVISHNNVPDWGMGSGGGVYCYNSNAVFNQVYIVKNCAYSGGGVHIDPLSSPHFTNCVIADNTLMSPGGSYAAGVYTRYEVYPVFTGCTVTRNRYAGRAAIHLGEVSGPAFINCVITDNQYGFQMVSNATATVTGCTITNHDDAALLNIGSGVPNMTNCWWGTDTGPHHATNPSGTGDELNGAASYNPWLMQPDPITPPPPPLNVSAVWTAGATGLEITVNWDPCPEAGVTYWVNWGTDSLAVFQISNQHATANSAVIAGFGPFLMNYVQVRAERGNGVTSWFSASIPVYVGSTDAADPAQTPVPARLSVSPNPFSGQTTIAYALGKPGPAELKIFNQRGQLIRHLAGGDLTPEGGSFRWDGCDDRGIRMPAGVYLCVADNGTRSASAKLLLTR